MAETVTAISCPAGEWTLISDGEPAAHFQWREDGAIGKCTFSLTLPDPDTLDYWTVRPRAPQNFNELSTSARIWAMPYGEIDLTMEVITP